MSNELVSKTRDGGIMEGKFMKGLYFCVTVLLFTGGIFSVYASDLIILRDGNVIEGKVTEISSSEIRYKRYDNLDGPTIIIPTTSVLSIRYENGNVEKFTEAVASAGHENARADRRGTPTMNPDKLNFGISLNGGGFIPYVGSGPSVSLDFSKGRFNSIIDIRSGFGVFSSGLSDVNEFFGVSLRFNYFHPSRIGGFYVGGLVEYSLGKQYIQQYWRTLATVHSLGPALNIGYKFVTYSGIYFRTGANVGYTFGKDVMMFSPDLSFGYNF